MPKSNFKDFKFDENLVARIEADRIYIKAEAGLDELPSPEITVSALLALVHHLIIKATDGFDDIWLVNRERMSRKGMLNLRGFFQEYFSQTLKNQGDQR